MVKTSNQGICGHAGMETGSDFGYIPPWSTRDGGAVGDDEKVSKLEDDRECVQGSGG